MPCTICFGEEGFPTECDKCKGYGALPCPVKLCFGGREACERCSGSGRLRFVMSSSKTKAGSSKCTDCNGKGWSKCRKCNGKGKVDCPPYDGFESCTACKANLGLVRCTVCAD